MVEKINPEIKEKVKELEKQYPGFKVHALRSNQGKLDIEIKKA